MASKIQKASNGRASAASNSKSTDAVPDAALTFSQDQLQAIIGFTDLMLKGAEEMRRCQMQAAHHAREHHEKAQALVAKARTPAELFDVQSELLRFDIEAAGRYWQQMASICAATQADALDLVNRSAATVGGDVAKLVGQPLPQVAARSTPAASEAPASTEVSAQAWNQWVDLGKQWTDMLYRTEAALH